MLKKRLKRLVDRRVLTRPAMARVVAGTKRNCLERMRKSCRAVYGNRAPPHTNCHVPFCCTCKKCEEHGLGPET